jgi:hypothetical protein
VSGSQRRGVEMTVTPERTAELVGLLEKALGLTPKPKPKPKVVVNEDGVVHDADVRVSPADPNYHGSDDGVVRVRRSDFVTVRVDLWEEQQAAKREERRRRRALDPCRLGLYGPIDDEDE